MKNFNEFDFDIQIGGLGDGPLEDSASLDEAETDNPEKAMDAWKTILAEDPQNTMAQEELKKLYYQYEKWSSLADMLKRQADELSDDPPEEKVALLKELIDIYNTYLFADEMVIGKYYRAIHRLDPRDRDVARKMLEIYKKERRWNDVLGVLSDEAGCTDDPNRKVELLMEVAGVWIDQLKIVNNATKPLEGVLAIDPTHLRAREILKDLYQRQRAWAPYLDLLEREVEELEEDAKLTLLRQMVDIASNRISDSERAAVLYKRILLLSPGDAEALFALEKRALQQKDWNGVAEILKARVGQEPDAEQRFELLVKLGSIYKNRLTDPAGAAEVWEQVIAIKPDNTAARQMLRNAYLTTKNWTALERLYTAAEDYSGLAGILETGAEKETDKGAKMPLLVRAAELYNGPAARPDRAIDIYEKVLALEPDNLDAVRALVPIYRLKSLWDRLFEMVSTVFAADREIPIEAGDLEALATLAAIARKKERWNEWAALTERRLDAVQPGDPGWRDIHLEAALTLQEKLGRTDDALRLHGLLLEHLPGNAESINALLPLLDQPDHRAAAAAIIKPQLELIDDRRLTVRLLPAIIENTEDKTERLVFQKQLGELHQSLFDPRPAFDTLLAALKDHPGDRELWESLFALSDELEIKGEIVSQLEEIFFTCKLDDESEVALAKILIDLFENELNRPAEAIVFHRRLLKDNPTEPRSFKLVEAHYLAEGQLEELFGVYEKAWESDLSDIQRKTLSKKLEVVSEDMLKAVPESASLYRDLLAYAPGDQRTNRLLAGALEASGRWRELVALLSSWIDSAGPDEAVGLRCRVASIQACHLGEADEAFDVFRDVLAEVEAHPAALDGLEALLDHQGVRFMAAALLKPVYLKHQKLAPLAKLLSVEAENPELSLAQRITVLSQLATLKERNLNDPAGGFHVLAKAFHLQPANQGVRAEMKRLAEKAGILFQYAETLESASGKLSADPKLAEMMLLEAARLYDETLEETDKAQAAYIQLLKRNLQDARVAWFATESLERILTRRGAFTDAVKVLRLKLKLASDEQRKKEVLYRIAGIEETHSGRPKEAIAGYREILDIDSRDLEAYKGLERVYEAEEMWVELMEVLRKRSNLETSPKVKRELFQRVAGLSTKLAGMPKRY